MWCKTPHQIQGLVLLHTSKCLCELDQFQVLTHTKNLHLQVLLDPVCQNRWALEYNFIIITGPKPGPPVYEMAASINKREKQISETHFSENILTIPYCHKIMPRHQPTIWESRTAATFEALKAQEVIAPYLTGFANTLRGHQSHAEQREHWVRTDSVRVQWNHQYDHWPSPSSWAPPAACSSYSSACGLHQWLHSAMEYSAAQDNPSKSSQM